jgi:hypothetical protein
MTEQKLSHTLQHDNQPIEKIDVMSLTQIDMSLADYWDCTDGDPNDPRVVALMDRYGITRDHFFIVSATDPEHPENDIVRVVTTDEEDFFTTNRSLTNALEARRLAMNDTTNQESTLEQEWIISKEDIKELGDLALGSAGVYPVIEANDAHTIDEVSEVKVEPDAENGLNASPVEQLADQSDDQEQAINKAKSVFDNRLRQLVDDYRSVIDMRRTSANEQAGGLFTLQKRAEQTIGEAHAILRSSADQPRMAFRAITGALDQLNELNSVLAVADEAVHSVGNVASQILSRATEHKEGLLRLGAEFRVVISEVGENNNSDMSAVDAVSGQAIEAVASQAAAASRLENSASDLRMTLRSSESTTEQLRRQVRTTIARLEEMSYLARQGRLDSDEYMAVVQSVRHIATGLEGGVGQARRIAVAAEDL